MFLLNYKIDVENVMNLKISFCSAKNFKSQPTNYLIAHNFSTIT